MLFEDASRLNYPEKAGTWNTLNNVAQVLGTPTVLRLQQLRTDLEARIQEGEINLARCKPKKRRMAPAAEPGDGVKQLQLEQGQSEQPQPAQLQSQLFQFDLPPPPHPVLAPNGRLPPLTQDPPSSINMPAKQEHKNVFANRFGARTLPSGASSYTHGPTYEPVATSSIKLQQQPTDGQMARQMQWSAMSSQGQFSGSGISRGGMQNAGALDRFGTHQSHSGQQEVVLSQASGSNVGPGASIQAGSQGLQSLIQHWQSEVQQQEQVPHEQKQTQWQHHQPWPPLPPAHSLPISTSQSASSPPGLQAGQTLTMDGNASSLWQASASSSQMTHASATHLLADAHPPAVAMLPQRVSPPGLTYGPSVLPVNRPGSYGGHHFTLMPSPGDHLVREPSVYFPSNTSHPPVEASANAHNDLYAATHPSSSLPHLTVLRDLSQQPSVADGGTMQHGEPSTNDEETGSSSSPPCSPLQDRVISGAGPGPKLPSQNQPQHIDSSVHQYQFEGNPCGMDLSPIHNHDGADLLRSDAGFLDFCRVLSADAHEDLPVLHLPSQPSTHEQQAAHFGMQATLDAHNSAQGGATSTLARHANQPHHLLEIAPTSAPVPRSTLSGLLLDWNAPLQ
jgi:hypothetical protein